jgi:serine/threonine protein phosphatase PrpC
MLHRLRNEMKPSTGRSANNEISRPLEALGAIRIGVRPLRGHDFVFVAERERGRCALVVGREQRDDWEEREEDEPSAALGILAYAHQSFLPLAEGTPARRLGRFEEGFLEAVSRSQEQLRQGAKQRTGEAPSLTLTLGYVDGTRLYIGHVGDDRCYVVRNEKLHRMTTDHTLLSPKLGHPQVNDPMLVRKSLSFIGGFSGDLHTETLAVDLEPDDIVFLCTAGITAAVPERSIEELLVEASQDRSLELDGVADAIFDLARQPQTSDRAVALARFRHSAER